MIIGITGSHRTGKTTFGRELAKKLNFEFLETSVSSFPIWKNTNINPSDFLSFAERLKIQTEIFNFSENTLFTKISKSKNIIIDRTYFDYLAYLLTNIDNTTSNLFEEEFDLFVKKCIEKQKSFFDFTIVIQPGIKVVEENGKSGKVFLSKPYMYALNNHIISLCYQNLEQNKFIIIPKEITNLENRIDYTLVKLFLCSNMIFVDPTKYV